MEIDRSRLEDIPPDVPSRFRDVRAAMNAIRAEQWEAIQSEFKRREITCVDCGGRFEIRQPKPPFDPYQTCDECADE